VPKMFASLRRTSDASEGEEGEREGERERETRGPHRRLSDGTPQSQRKSSLSSSFHTISGHTRTPGKHSSTLNVSDTSSSSMSMVAEVAELCDEPLASMDLAAMMPNVGIAVSPSAAAALSPTFPMRERERETLQDLPLDRERETLASSVNAPSPRVRERERERERESPVTLSRSVRDSQYRIKTRSPAHSLSALFTGSESVSRKSYLRDSIKRLWKGEEDKVAPTTPGGTTRPVNPTRLGEVSGRGYCSLDGGEGAEWIACEVVSYSSLSLSLCVCVCVCNPRLSRTAALQAQSQSRHTR
ncbi:hypothetical protein KIPB_010435, partial [Kipferlia bialata]